MRSNCWWAWSCKRCLLYFPYLNIIELIAGENINQSNDSIILFKTFQKKTSLFQRWLQQSHSGHRSWGQAYFSLKIFLLDPCWTRICFFYAQEILLHFFFFSFPTLALIKVFVFLQLSFNSIFYLPSFFHIFLIFSPFLILTTEVRFNFIQTIQEESFGFLGLFISLKKTFDRRNSACRGFCGKNWEFGRNFWKKMSHDSLRKPCVLFIVW